MENFKTDTEKILSLFDYDKEKNGVNPNVVWFYILVSFAISLLLLVWFGSTLFLQVRTDSFFKNVNEARRVPSVTIDKERLAETTGLYEEKRRTQNERKNIRLWVEDPSL